ncbi:HAL protein kinase [Nannizzia gypsea CBS 118893]|uniref:non-specific serine/threonine protein kinase n=1 Tax=Arthroderma gypseum (strain ATCC MYA-4604 / CBS 118893) TaxID=535722 RepID=E4UYN2_ARTGP|nr:HAL protein kinase [Nannizzia gypsea CBS 118893]EFR03212.1 HAL protein kinase [Nannizzia gypsea CBS 118893]
MAPLTSSDSAEKKAQEPNTVRFASQNQEIEPPQNLLSSSGSPDTIVKGNVGPAPAGPGGEFIPFDSAFQKSRLQETRLHNFAFDPVSLPASRAPSRDSSIRDFNRSIAISPPPSQPQSPAFGPIDLPEHPKDGHNRALLETTEMTPEASSSSERPSKHYVKNQPSFSSSRPSSPSTAPSTRPVSGHSNASSAPKLSNINRGKFFVGPSEESPPGTPRFEVKRPASPLLGSGTITPLGDENDPYARDKRPPQTKNLANLDQRFIFGGVDAKRRPHKSHSTTSLSTHNIPRSAHSSETKDHHHHKHPHIFGGKKDRHHDDKFDAKHSGSMSELRRFFRIDRKHKRGESPSSMKSSRSSIKHIPFQSTAPSVPFADDHGLQSKYGKLGKVLGAGAGGSVRLLKRSSDGVTFAVKQFREKHSWESEREYAKKVTAEFCIGSTLHHGNIIETLDIIRENGNWYEVMEFAPYDLFAIVMTGKMTREEISCAWLQIVNGVSYLHSMGLAHRDLKLDNVVVNDKGIMKLIDFGSAVVFRYPFETGTVQATGVVGSDPYLAPEVYDNKKYDPCAADMWSLAIIFCCMILRRFPWKQPKEEDNSFKLFIAEPSPNTPPPEEFGNPSRGRPRSVAGEPGTHSMPNGNKGDGHHHRRRSDNKEYLKHEHAANDPKDESSAKGAAGTEKQPATGQRQEPIKGPWRLLRVLPRESRLLISRLLKLDPRERATLQDVLDNEWVRSCEVCRQEESGQTINAPGHTHILEPPSPPPAKK